MLDGRTQGKYWTFELYPDSMDPESFKKLEYMGGSYCHIMVSPLHDSDIRKDGFPKKPHYHVLICYGNKVNYLTFYNFACLELHGVIPPEPRVTDPDHLRVYFVHRTPKAIQDGKYIYRCEDCLFFSDKWYLEEYKRLCENLETSGIDQYDTIIELLELCDFYDIKGISSLLEFVKKRCPQFSWFIIKNQSTIKSFLASQCLRLYDQDTGVRIVKRLEREPDLFSKIKKCIH